MNKAYNNDYVTTGKPSSEGCFYVSFTATADQLPKDATSKVVTGNSKNDCFMPLGDLNGNGYTLGKSVDTTKHKGWRGVTVLTEINSVEYTLKTEFIEINRETVAMLRHGKKNVKSDELIGVKSIDVVMPEIEYVSLVIDELEASDTLRRTVIPRAVVSSFDDVPHKSGDLVVYGMTFDILDDGTGTFYKIYRAKRTPVL